VAVEADFLVVNHTLQVLKVIHEARGIPKGEDDATSSFACRYHSNSGKPDKNDIAKQFVGGDFPIISCTMALGLGANWKRVRSVVHLGRGDPSSIAQEIGRCGRDGKPGLAVIFVIPKRKNGNNMIESFDDVKLQSIDNRMDALAITPVCLCVVFSLENLSATLP
jgi:superfamily II DNA helicase RecQ